MIVPMKKLSVVTLSDKKVETLRSLRRLGLMHIEETEGNGERLLKLKQRLSLLESGIYTLTERVNKDTVQVEATTEQALVVAENISASVEEKKSIKVKISALENELQRLEGWGEIDPCELKYLAEKGIKISLYEMPTAEFKALDNNVKTIVLSKTKHTVSCVVIGDVEQSESLAIYRVELPRESTSQIKQNIQDCQNKISNLEREITEYTEYLNSMKSAVLELQKQIEFEAHSSGMAEECLSENPQNAVKVSYFKGYIEEESLDKMRTAAKQNGWGILIEEPTVEDNVPTKLKNNKFVSLIYPLTDFLGTVPGYFEYDISGWFLGFILIFFGIIFGDGGYGLLITAAAAIPILMAFFKKEKISPAFLLAGLFGLSTVIWGTLTCTWFGLSAEKLPMWLQKLSVPVISNVYADKIWQPFWVSGEVGLTTSQNLQIFCFTLALIQLTAAHIKGAVRNRKSLKMLGDIGSALQLIGIYYIVLSLVVNAEVFSLGLVLGAIPVGIVSIALIGVGFVLSFVFSNYEGSVIKAILSSLTNIVSVLLGVVNVFSDIVSYIRLWAVGLAGAAISATVNELAGPLLGNFMFMVLAVVLLVFGHGLNMILNVLSVIVHGIRLNTLEFSSHLDMSWSGHKFKPFEE